MTFVNCSLIEASPRMACASVRMAQDAQLVTGQVESGRVSLGRVVFPDTRSPPAHACCRNTTADNDLSKLAHLRVIGFIFRASARCKDSIGLVL